MSINNTLLEINNLVVEYVADRKVIKAVNNVSFTLNKGETLGLVGETGAGKTTIAKAIMRILPDPPAKIKSGEILFEGKDIMKMSEHKIRDIRGNSISMIFQDPMTALNPIMTIGKQIAETIGLHEKLSRAEAEIKAIKMLEKVGIPGERFSEYPHQFSGGMKQRVVIAMALACEPDLLLADEPTTALDVTIQAQVLEMMDKLKKELNTSVLMITHDLGVVAGTCDKVAIVYSGEIVEYGTTAQVFDYPGHPYTKGLFNSLPRLTSNEKRLKPIKGMMPDPTHLPVGCKFRDRCPHAIDECREERDRNVNIGNEHFVKCDIMTKEV
ncbi:ABC transporter ATP-binding protein [Fusibacter ferrireducens]|uniref:ABC transporter ATP-binding protein n=1 Tax=Fusibacter ferrireducens TaxID=2785058 RepID=A0ABR9ZVF7_9FIRM|nr:ABC transporter ATP-binding protein [Fusibacter ferrireducens]MBF4694450.1 ABC transporter ATP-binding protein [Fusibacter ferrireducens]